MGTYTPACLATALNTLETPINCEVDMLTALSQISLRHLSDKPEAIADFRYLQIIDPKKLVFGAWYCDCGIMTIGLAKSEEGVVWRPNHAWNDYLKEWG